MHPAPASRNWLTAPLGALMSMLRACIDRGANFPGPRFLPGKGGEPNAVRASTAGTTNGLDAKGPGTPAQRPVRVVRVLRVLDSSQPRCGLGRMMISGSVDEVCAELDRLVWHEQRADRNRQPALLH